MAVNFQTISTRGVFIATFTVIAILSGTVLINEFGERRENRLLQKTETELRVQTPEIAPATPLADSGSISSHAYDSSVNSFNHFLYNGDLSERIAFFRSLPENASENFSSAQSNAAEALWDKSPAEAILFVSEMKWNSSLTCDSGYLSGNG